ncbi:M20/M25/M40 family metallo-hydrolase [Sphingobium nicotianae]|uniref:M20/M25/M40 family metallo-hydrolase n=1 Tax=Sphingobium nicotianae TaxID=2782607 RepID=A0A9X1DEJ0_9SPHN|nr:M20/M25/M40 family metallo-hydrolase [Sphingobium nicotianae]MBT2188424.1 M20/M25/M40 family metallo-hydrolase [Sphingobium nicotianae]
MTRSALTALALPLILLAAPAAAKLSAAEQAIAKSVDADQPWALALLERLVNQNSGTRNIPGVIKVAEMVRPELEALGFTVAWKPMDAVNRAGHIIATHKGRPGTTKILLIGHLDTVFEPSSPFQHFSREGDVAKGPGVGDDKGGMVVMFTALRAMKAAGTLKDANIEIVLTGDEESSGEPVSVSRADLIAAGKRADVALDFEGLSVIDGQDYGSIARRSANDYTVTATGKTAHSSGIFSPTVGDGAIYELVRIISRFRQELPEPNLTFNIGLIAGGATVAMSPDESQARATGKVNIIPPIAIARGDFRTLSPEQTARVKAKMEAIIAAHAPQTNATITFKEGYPPMPPTSGNQKLLAALNVINADLGLPAMPALDPLKRGAGDISFVAADIDGLVGLGASSDGDHTPAEQVDLTSFPRQGKRAAIIMTRLSKEKARK